MEKRNIVVIGASMGGFDALKRIVANLPSDFEASIFIVWHMSADVMGILPQVINKLNTIPASNALDGELILSNHIYVAPPGHHMLIDNGFIRVTHGPKENLFRPAVDPLFRSAANNYGNRVIGIVLSGGLDDGTSGLWQIKSKNGIAIVQDPENAENPSMPQSALNKVKVDYCLSIEDISDVLIHLAKQEVEVEMKNNSNKTEGELNIAAEGNALQYGASYFGEISPYSCPECHGVLSQIMEDNILRFRCHTGHAYSTDSLLLSLSRKTEDSLYNVIRGMDETIFLLNHLGDHYSEANEPKLAATYFKEANKTIEKSNQLRNIVHSHEELTLEKICYQQDQTQISRPTQQDITQE
jgi:two-component system chemotaxis response regulator CheB